MDFITGLPKSQGLRQYLWCGSVDKVQTFCSLETSDICIPLAAWLKLLLRKPFAYIHGVPTSIVSDRDPIFVGNFLKELFKLEGTQLRVSIASHPQTNNQTEVVNQCLETFLHCFIKDQPKTWAL